MRVLSVIALALASGCGGAAGIDTNVDCATATIPAYGDVAMFSVCENCHATTLSREQRHAAPLTVNFDVYEDAVRAAAVSVSAVSRGAMPVQGYTVTPDEVSQFYAWAACGTPKTVP